MNIKSLLAGSTGILALAGAAQAADAVVIGVAATEPVEYVRVCDVYGAGYFYIPGTETCLRVGGYVRFQAGFGDLFGKTRADRLTGNDNRSWDPMGRLSLQTWTGTETELGTLKTFTETRFTYKEIKDSKGNEAYGTDTTLNFAWIELGGFRVGKDESAFTTFLGYAGSVIADDLVPYGPYDTLAASYTFSGPGGISVIAAIEQGSKDYTVDSYMPHLVGGLKVDQGWGSVGLVAGYDSNYEKATVKGRADFKLTDSFSVFAMVGWGDDKAVYDAVKGTYVSGSFYKPWEGSWAAWGGFKAKVSSQLAFAMQASYDEAKNFVVVGSLPYEVVPSFKVTPELVYRDSFDSSADNNKGEMGGLIRFQRSF